MLLGKNALALALGLGLVMLGGSRAHADDPQQPQPWTVGVSAEHKAVAQQHLDAGNTLLLNFKYVEALAEYKLAIDAWDHPAIRFNMVRCLIQLERPLEASDELKRALAYGAAPFDDVIYGEALAFEKLLGNEIGELEINCDQHGVVLTMDGKPLIACPGKDARRVLPGQHQIVGKKVGFLPRTVEIVVLGGKHEHAAVTLDPLSKAARIEHRWPTWIPWTVFGGGFVLAGIGGLIHLKATDDQAEYSAFVSKQCPDGCPTGSLDHRPESNAKLENEIGIGILTVGSAAVVAGSVMIFLNRGRTVYDTEHLTPSIIPMRDGAAFTVTRRF